MDYDTDINKYLKKWKCSVKGITLKMLLSHTSGADESLYNNGELPQKTTTTKFTIKYKYFKWKINQYTI